MVRRIVIQRQDRRLHELGRTALWDLEDELGEVRRVRLEEIEEMLVRLKAITALLAQCLQAAVECV